MPDKERGGAGRRTGGGPAHGSAAAGPAAAPFGGKVDEYVAKVVPEHLLATVFAATAAGALVFFILMIIGFAGSPEEATQAALAEVEGTLDEVSEELSETKKSLEEATAAQTEAVGKAEAAEKKAGDLGTQLGQAVEAQEKLGAQVADLQKGLKAEQAGARKAEKELKTTAAQAERDRKSAEKESGALKLRTQKLEGELAEVGTQFKELKQQKDEQAKIDERARQAFDAIMATVSEIDDPEKRIEAIERLRRDSEKDLAGTVYIERLDEDAGRQKALVEKKEREALKLAKREAKKTFDEAKRSVALAEDYEAQMAILTGAKENLAGSTYEVSISKEIEACEAKHKKKVFADAMSKLKEEGEHDAQMAILTEAKEKLAGGKYEASISREIAAREAAQKKRVARDAYEEVVAKIRSNPEARAENLRALEEALLKTEGTRYGKALQRLADSWQK